MRKGATTDCAVCGTTFPQHVARLYCSRDCFLKAAPLREADRFWSKVQKTDYCWNWTGKTNGDGYGQFWSATSKRQELAHRVSWRLANKPPIPDGLFLLHSCDNARCVRPDHTSPGTLLQNYHDARRRGRLPSRSGENNGRTKLRPGDVDLIRQRYIRGATSLKSIADEFGISTSYVSTIVHGRTFAARPAFEPSSWLLGFGA